MGVVALDNLEVGTEVLLDYGREYWSKLASASEDEEEDEDEDENYDFSFVNSAFERMLPEANSKRRHEEDKDDRDDNDDEGVEGSTAKKPKAEDSMSEEDSSVLGSRPSTPEGS